MTRRGREAAAGLLPSSTGEAKSLLPLSESIKELAYEILRAGKDNLAALPARPQALLPFGAFPLPVGSLERGRARPWGAPSRPQQPF